MRQHIKGQERVAAALENLAALAEVEMRNARDAADQSRAVLNHFVDALKEQSRTLADISAWLNRHGGRR
jgi:hypothetical protein